MALKVPENVIHLVSQTVGRVTSNVPSENSSSAVRFQQKANVMKCNYLNT